MSVMDRRIGGPPVKAQPLTMINCDHFKSYLVFFWWGWGDLSISSGVEINAMTTKINGRSSVPPSRSVYLFTVRLHEEQRPTKHLLLRGKVTFSAALEGNSAATV